VICTLGDVLLDVIVRLSAEVAPGADTPAETRLATGGQAANVAAWVVELGGSARCVAKQADDPAGALARTLLEGRGVELAGPVAAGTTGTVVALVSADGERTMATDRGVSVELRADDGSIELAVRDDGRGFDVGLLPQRIAEGHIGLQSQRERVESAGGRFEIRSSPGRGTAVEINLPD